MEIGTPSRGSGIRELFIEELADVRGGGDGCPTCYTTQACCEEGPFDGCCVVVFEPGD